MIGADLATEMMMRATLIATLVAAGFWTQDVAAQPQASPRFWPSVQKICDQTAATKPSPLAAKIAQTALDEHYRFGGHQIDSNGRLFRFGLVESEQEEEASGPQAQLGHLGWWQVLKYWRALYGTNPMTVALACRAAGIDRSVFHTVFNLSRQHRRVATKISDLDHAQIGMIFSHVQKSEALDRLKTVAA